MSTLWVVPIFKMCWLKPGEIKQISKLHKAFKWLCRICGPDLLSCELSSLYLRYTKASELHPLETYPLSNTMHWECGADWLLSCEVQLCPFAYFWSLPLTVLPHDSLSTSLSPFKHYRNVLRSSFLKPLSSSCHIHQSHPGCYSSEVRSEVERWPPERQWAPVLSQFNSSWLSKRGHFPLKVVTEESLTYVR